MQFDVTDAQVAAFHRTYLTPATIGTEFGLNWHSARAILNAHGIRPFSPDGGHYGSLYLRSEAEPCLSASSR